jgi:hypothetical protein
MPTDTDDLADTKRNTRQQLKFPLEIFITRLNVNCLRENVLRSFSGSEGVECCSVSDSCFLLLLMSIIVSYYFSFLGAFFPCLVAFELCSCAAFRFGIQSQRRKKQKAIKAEVLCERRVFHSASAFWNHPKKIKNKKRKVELLVDSVVCSPHLIIF